MTGNIEAPAGVAGQFSSPRRPDKACLPRSMNTERPTRKRRSTASRSSTRLTPPRREVETLKWLTEDAFERSLFVSQHPVLVTTSTSSAVFGGNPGAPRGNAHNGDAYFPSGVSAAVPGHVHLSETIDFACAYPPTLIAGHSGDSLSPPLPSLCLLGASAAPGATN